MFTVAASDKTDAKASFSNWGAPSATVGNWIVTNGTTGVITGNPGGTPNVLLYKATL